jgi:hypothetical protein
MQYLARSLERTLVTERDKETGFEFNPGETPFTDWFFGPDAVYTSDASLANALMMDNARHHTLDNWAAAHDEITAIRVSLVEDGLARLVDDPEVRDEEKFKRIGGEDDPRWGEIVRLESRIADYEHIAIDRATNIAAAADFIKALTLFMAPTSPRLMREEQILVGEMWQSVELGSAIRQGEGPEAYTQWKNSVDPRRWDEMAGVVLAFLNGQVVNEFGINQPTVSAAKRHFDELYPNLSAYLTPTKIFTDRWVDTETVGEFFEAVGEGKIRYAEPEVYFMRHFKQRLSWQQGAERLAFFERNPEPANPIKYALENWRTPGGYMEMVDNQKVERDYLNFVDAEQFDNAWGDALEEEKERRAQILADGGAWTPEGTYSEEEQLWREQQKDQLLLTQQTVDNLIDDLESYDIDPTRADEVRRALFALNGAIDDAIARAGDLDDYGAFSREEALITEYFDTVYREYTNELTDLYAIAFNSTDASERSLAFDNVRQFVNENWYAGSTVQGMPVPSATKWQTALKTPDQLRVKALKAIGKKVDWLHQPDIEAIAAAGDRELVMQVLPTTPEAWLLYTLRNTNLNAIEEARLAGLMKQGEATKAKAEIERRFEEAMVAQNRVDELDFQSRPPAQQLQSVGLLPETLVDAMGVANQYLALMEEMDKTGDDILWNGTFWPAIQSVLQTTPGAEADFVELIGIMYDEQLWLNGAKKLFLGNFGRP